MTDPTPEQQPDDEATFQISVRAEGAIGVLEWSGATTPEILAETISLAADDALLGHGLRRLEIYIPAPDMMARRAAQQAGFRLEGIRRQALAIREDEYVDIAEYGRVVSDIVYGPDGFSGVMNSVLPKTRAIAHVLLRNEEGQYLFCSTTYKDEWELPGGVVEPHEPPRVAAEREVLEELGLELQVGDLLAVDWLPPSQGWDDALECIFDGGVLSEEEAALLHPADDEIAELHWGTVEEILPHLSENAAARLHALHAMPRKALYLEAGSESYRG